MDVGLGMDGEIPRDFSRRAWRDPDRSRPSAKMSSDGTAAGRESEQSSPLASGPSDGAGANRQGKRRL